MTIDLWEQSVRIFICVRLVILEADVRMDDNASAEKSVRDRTQGARCEGNHCQGNERGRHGSCNISVRSHLGMAPGLPLKHPVIAAMSRRRLRYWGWIIYFTQSLAKDECFAFSGIRLLTTSLHDLCEPPLALASR